MDFIIGLPKSEGNNFIMVVVERLTKHAYFCALYHPFNVSTVVAAFMDTVHKLHGNPKILLVIEIQFSLEKFGLNYFLILILSWLTVHIIILSPIGKLR